MFNTVKFGKSLSKLRKNADMTQSELADKLNLTRQAISKYERGESFPDISVLVNIAAVFNTTIDSLITGGEPSTGERLIFKSVAGTCDDASPGTIEDLVNLAPLLKPSILKKLSDKFAKDGIDISNIVLLAEYLSDDAVAELIENSSFDEVSNELLERFLPILDFHSKDIIFQRILNGEIDWHFIKTLLPYAEYMTSQIEAAVVFGALPTQALKLLKEYQIEKIERWQANNKR